MNLVDAWYKATLGDTPARATKVEIVARAMAKAEGHDPDYLVIGGHAPMMINGKPYMMAPVHGSGWQVWQCYMRLAEAAVDALEGTQEKAA